MASKKKSGSVSSKKRTVASRRVVKRTKKTPVAAAKKPSRRPVAKHPARPPVAKHPARPPKSVKRPPGRGTKGVVAGVAAGGAVLGAAAAGSHVQLESLQNKLGEIQEELLLTRARDDMGDIESALAMLPAELEALRKRGYVFRSFLDQKLGVLAEQWEETRDRVSQEIDRRTRDLEMEASTAESALRQAAAGSASQLARANSTIDTLEHKVDAAQSAVGAMYENIQDNIQQSRSQMQQISWLLDQVDEASFEIFPAEDPVAAVRAQYMETKKEGPEGVLFLTDDRLLFEQKEEVATKKVLFIATEKETLQEPVFAVTVGQIEEVKTSSKGFMGRKQLLDLTFASEADLSGAQLRLMGADNEEWAALIGRVKSGEIANERTKPKDEAAVEAARSAPTKCTTCGATLDVEIVRGMREIKCQYCGSVVRL